VIYTGNCLEILPTLEAESVQCVVTSPPYFGLRDYGVDGQIGLEDTPEAYVEKLVAVFREVRRVLRDNGTLWLNLGDSYAQNGGGYEGTKANQSGVGAKVVFEGNYFKKGPRVCPTNLKPKDLVGIPWRVAFALQADGWYLRSEIIWAKPNPMPESVTDRPTKSHEQIFLLTKSAKYYWDQEAVKEDGPSYTRKASGYKGFDKTHTGNNQKGGFADKDTTTNGRNLRSVWTITTKPFKEAHFATFPPEIPEICIKAGTSDYGCCPVCFSPWVRKVNRVPATSVPCPKEQLSHMARGGTGSHTGTVGKSGGGRIDGYSETLGWEPTCTHNLNPIPCTVLDPFSGAGTTGLVAEKLGRKYIGIELNPSYVEMSDNRIYNECGGLLLNTPTAALQETLL
jgi:DNA modification methylase